MNMTSPSTFSALAQINATSIGENKTCNESKINDVMLTLASLTMITCVLGMLGNGLVIWLLGSSVKRNTFAIYIINLSVADFGFLTSELTIEIHGLSTHFYCGFPYTLFQTVLLLMYSAGQFLLTIISIDRCISVLFPIWYRCHRPVHLFTAVCAVIWAVSFILSSLHFTIATALKREVKYSLNYTFIVNALLCLPLMTISSVILFTKLFFISRSQRRRKLLTVVLLTLFFFLVLGFPLNLFYFIREKLKTVNKNIVHSGYFFISINSSINPLIYYLVGREKSKTQKSIKNLLQRVFKEEEDSNNQVETSEDSKI